MRTKLNPRMERFCFLIVKGEIQSTAYEQAGYSTRSKEVAAANACNLLKIPKVQARIQELRGELVKRTMISLESLTDDLIDIRDKAIKAGSFGPAVQSVIAIARMHGFMVDKAELTVMHRPAPLPTKVLELSEDDWVRQFGAGGLERNRELSLLRAVKAKE
jgi:hypothetical protein